MAHYEVDFYEVVFYTCAKKKKVMVKPANLCSKMPQILAYPVNANTSLYKVQPGVEW